ncbi:hypothetical protein Tco_0164681 [Tanacetum coccineum]
MSSSNKSPRDYSRKHKKEILEPKKQSQNLPPSPPSSPPNSPIFDITPLPPSPNSSNPTSSFLPPQISTQNHSENHLHELLHLSNLLDINIQHAIELTNRSPPSSPFTHPPCLDQKCIISVDDQIDYDIIFDDQFVDNDSGHAEHDTNAHDQSLHDFETLINNVQVDAEKNAK